MPRKGRLQVRTLTRQEGMGMNRNRMMIRPKRMMKKTVQEPMLIRILKRIIQKIKDRVISYGFARKSNGSGIC